MIIDTYNRAAAVIYAKKWALLRNPRFYDFEDIGGDCTNFASQCIFAGAGVMNYTPETGWYYISSYNRTPSWTGVEYLYSFLTTNQSVGPFGHVSEYLEAQIGDIVQLGRPNGEFYHTLVITATRPDILVSAHTIDALNRPLASYNAAFYRFIHIDGVRKEG